MQICDYRIPPYRTRALTPPGTLKGQQILQRRDQVIIAASVYTRARCSGHGTESHLHPRSVRVLGSNPIVSPRLGESRLVVRGWMEGSDWEHLSQSRHFYLGRSYHERRRRSAVQTEDAEVPTKVETSPVGGTHLVGRPTGCHLRRDRPQPGSFTCNAR